MQRPGTKLDTITIVVENGRITRAEGRAGGKTVSLMGVQSATMARQDAPVIWMFSATFILFLALFGFYFPSSLREFIFAFDLSADIFCIPVLFIVAVLALVLRRPVYVVSITISGGGRYHYVEKKEVRAEKIVDDFNHMIAHRR